jgi:hypothetical protein
MESEPSNPVEIINGRRIKGDSWGWMLEYERILLAKFPGQPLVTWKKFETQELAREAATSLGPLQEVDESKYATQTP